MLIEFDFPVSHQIAANSLSPPLKRRRTEEIDSNVETEESAVLPLPKPKCVSDDEQTLPSNNNFSSRTLNVGDTQFAKMLMEKSKKMENLEGTDFYAAPLKKYCNQIGPTIFNHFVFYVDENIASLQMDQVKEHKTFLLVGESDFGKISLIDCLFNFIVGVDWNDPFRFLLKEDGQDETQSISVYEIHYSDGFRIPFSLTIVDVPVCNDTPPHDFAEMLGNFLKSGAIQQLDLIGLVSAANSVPSPACQSVLSFFGKDLKENINCLWTFADVERNPLGANAFVESLPFHDFHNLEFLSPNGHCDPDTRAIYWKSFEDFFRSLVKMDPNQLSQTKRVLEERNRLEMTFGELRKLVKKGTALREKIVESKKMITDYQVKIEVNKKVKTTRQTSLPTGLLATNCNNCGVVCSVHLYSDIGKHASSTCSMCPGKCNWNLHAINVSYLLKSTVENIPPDPKEVKKLEICSENLKKFIDEERSNSMDLEVLRCQVNVYIRGLNNIALRPFVTSPEYVDLIV